MQILIPTPIDKMWCSASCFLHLNKVSCRFFQFREWSLSFFFFFNSTYHFIV